MAENANKHTKATSSEPNWWSWQATKQRKERRGIKGKHIRRTNEIYLIQITVLWTKYMNEIASIPYIALHPKLHNLHYLERTDMLNNNYKKCRKIN